MDVWVDRKKMDGLIQGAAKLSLGGRPLTTLTHGLLYARMPEGQRAKLLGTTSGGDDEWSASVWVIPGIGRRQLYVKRAKLAEVIRSASPWSPPPPPEVAERQAAARARLRSMRPLPSAEPEQVSLFG
jgi:hypothetical protein